MSQGEVIALVQDAIWTLLVLSAPVLGVSIVVGLIISIIQTTTSIQELTLTFVPKLVAIFVTLALTAGWMFSTMLDYANSLFERMIRWGLGF